MTRIAVVNLALSPRSYWFDAKDFEASQGDAVVVRTARGVELGKMAKEIFEATEEDMGKLSSPLQPVLRIATEEDVDNYHENERLGKEALAQFKDIVKRRNSDMHPVLVEFLLDGNNAVFYFEADHRIDFRDIVRELSALYHVHVDMRQIGARDEARMIGGYGHCGQELCCSRMGGEFCSVSIRMAKEQSLSLNPEKISGCCGRLMCCLRYEYDNYKGFNGRAPKLGGTVHTPDGDAKVSHIDALREIIDVKIQIDGKDKLVHIPLSGFLPPEENAKRPNTVSEEAWEEALKPPEPTFNSSIFFTGSTSGITGSDKLGEAKAVRRNRANSKNITGSSSMVERDGKPKRRNRKSTSSSFKPTEEELAAVEPSTPKRRRRSIKVNIEGAEEISHRPAGESTGNEKQPHERSRRSRRSRSRRGKSSEAKQAGGAGDKKTVRPGQKSSGLSAVRDAANADGGQPREKSSGRRRRRRGSRGRGGSNPESSAKAPESKTE